MLARSEDEFELFQKMDNERIMNQDPGKPPLMEESELPDFLWWAILPLLIFSNLSLLANRWKKRMRLKNAPKRKDFTDEDREDETT